MKRILLIAVSAILSLTSVAQKNEYETTAEIWEVVSTEKNREHPGLNTNHLLKSQECQIKLRIAELTTVGPALMFQITPYPDSKLGLMFLFSREQGSWFANGEHNEDGYEFDGWVIGVHSAVTEGHCEIVFIDNPNAENSKLRYNLHLNRYEKTTGDMEIDPCQIILTHEQYWAIKRYVVENCENLIKFSKKIISL